MKSKNQTNRRLLKHFYDEINKQIVPEGYYDYIYHRMNSYCYQNNEFPGVQMYPALEEMLNKDVSEKSIIDLVRVVQLEMIEHILITLGGESIGGKINWSMSFRDLNNDKEYKLESWALYENFNMSQFVPKKKLKNSDFKSSVKASK